MNTFCKGLRGTAALGTLALLGTGNAAHAAPLLVSYFNFNTLTNGAAVNTAAILPSSGNGLLSSTFSSAGVSGMTGTTMNAEGADPAGQALGLTGGGSATFNNGSFLDYSVNTRSFAGISLSFAIQGTAAGFSSDSLSVSANGGASYTVIASSFNPTVVYTAKTVDLSAFTALNNNPNVRFRFTFNGATTTTGENRIDNLKLTAATPAPSSALVAVLGLLPGAAILRKRRK